MKQLSSPSPRQFKRLNPWQRVALLLTYFTASFLLSRFAQVYGPSPAVSLIYPSAALDLVLPMMFGFAWLPALFANAVVSAVASELLGLRGFSLVTPTLYLYGVLKVIFYGGVVWLLTKRLGVTANLARLRDVSWFLFFGVLVAPLLLSFAVIGLFVWRGMIDASEYMLNVLAFWAGDATGIALLAPLLLVHQHFSGKNLRLPKLQRGRNARLTFWLGLPLISLAAFFIYRNQHLGFLDLTYIIFVPMLLIAVSSGFKRSTVAVLLLNLTVLLVVNFRPTNLEMMALQFNLLTVSYVSLLISAVFTEYHRSREDLRYRAYHDLLTGLPNRAHLLLQLGRVAQHKTGRYALLFIDLDRFKSINDTFGHSVGDAFLMQVGHRIKACLRSGDMLARLGGDEFAALLPDIGSVDEAIMVTQKIEAALAEPSTIEGYEVFAQASVGITMARAGDADSSDALQKADTAMRQAKNMGRATYTVFDDAMQHQINERLQLERELRRALELGQLEVHYQPIVSLSTGHILGAEALLRWCHGDAGFVPPLTFIPIAEETGLIGELSEWLMYTAFTHGPKEGYLAVNLSVRQLQQGNLVKRVKEILDETGFPAERLVLEVTESMVMDDLEHTIKLLKGFSDLGARVAMDDFGTGYASLSYLKRLPVHTLKIDRSFLRGVPEDESDVSLVRTILAMAENLKLKVVAEGVETAAQEEFLRAHGCEQVQGYYYGRPLPVEAFAQYIKQRRQPATGR